MDAERATLGWWAGGNTNRISLHSTHTTPLAFCFFSFLFFLCAMSYNCPTRSVSIFLVPFFLVLCGAFRGIARRKYSTGIFDIHFFSPCFSFLTNMDFISITNVAFCMWVGFYFFSF